MKASLISKIILVLCVLSLIIGGFSIDKHQPYLKSIKKGQDKESSIVSNANKVAVLELEGPIATSYESSFFSKEANAANLLKSLMSIDTDKEIKGIIIKINSPGGTVAMSQNIYNQIIKLRKNKPVVVVMDDVAASGGYYIASAADRIIAQGGTLTGSIGVIFSFMDYHNLLSDKLAIKNEVIKSGTFKDIGSGTRAMTSEERALMQDIVNDSYSQFVDAIKRGRVDREDNYSAEKTVLTMENLHAYADGRIFSGKQAKAYGFVDTIGDMDIAKITIEKILQEKNSNNLPVKLISYSVKTSFTDYFSSLTEYNSKSKVNFSNFLPTSMILSKRPLYLWE